MNGQSYRNITDRLRSVVGRYRLTAVAEALWVSAGLLLILTAAFSLAEYFLYLTPAAKHVVAGLLLVIPGAAFVVLVIVSLTRSPDLDGAARMVERRFPGLGDRLISAVQLGRRRDSGDLQGQSTELVDALIEHVDRETARLDMSAAVPGTRLVRLMRTGLYGLGSVLLLAVLFPGPFLGGLFRLSDLDYAYMRPGGTSIYTAAGDASIIRGEDFTVTGFVAGEREGGLSVLYRWRGDGSWNMRPVRVEDGSGSFELTIEKPTTSFDWYLELGRTTTPGSSVTVIERPVVEGLAMRLVYPSYTGLGTVERTDNDGSVRAPAGTDVRLTVTSNKPLSRMTLQWSDSTTTPGTIDGSGATASFTVERDIDYSIGLVDTLGIGNVDPITYSVTAAADEAPEITILSPTGDIMLPRSQEFPVAYRARDDFGITRIELHYIPSDGSAGSITLQSPETGSDVLDEYRWNLGGLDILPDDTVSYYLTVRDNDAVNGPKKGVSDTLTVKVPSLADLFDRTIGEQTDGIRKLRDMTRRLDERGDSLDDVRRKAMQGGEMEWSDKNAVGEAIKDLESMQQDVRDISDAVEETARTLSEEDMAALETIEKLRTISDIMEQIADGEMKDALRRMFQAAEITDPEQLKKALDSYEVTAEKIQEKLDRMIAMLEQVKTLQRFEMTRRMLDELAARQTELAERFSSGDGDASLAHEQERIAADMEALENELEELAGELGEQFGMDTSALSDMLSGMDISEEMGEAASDMEAGRSGEASEGHENIRADMAKLMSSMGGMEAAMKAMNTGELRERMVSAALDLMAVSRVQEELLHGAERVTAEEASRRELEVLGGLDTAERALRSLAEVSVEAGAVLDNMAAMARLNAGKAVDEFAQGNTRNGVNAASVTLGTLNGMVQFLTIMLGTQSDSGQGMPGDLMDQLQQLASGQLSLQMQMSQGGLSQEQMMQLAAEQQKLAEMLQEAARKADEDARFRQMLEQLAREMDDTADMMRRNEERELVERRQLDIYRRLLDARRSRREKDEEDPERKSWTARRDVSDGADELAGDLGEKRRDLNERIRQAMEDDFAPEYRSLIRRYFESLLRDDVSGGER